MVPPRSNQTLALKPHKNLQDLVGTLGSSWGSWGSLAPLELLEPSGAPRTPWVRLWTLLLLWVHSIAHVNHIDLLSRITGASRAKLAYKALFGLGGARRSSILMFGKKEETF